MNNNARRRRIRKQMYKRQKGLCWICGERMAISPLAAGSLRFATFDHLVPKSEGGTGAQANLRLAHKKCNSLRGSVPVANVLALQVSSAASAVQSSQVEPVI